MSTGIARVLPADVFDAMEFSALAFGGIGPFSVMTLRRPCCAYGHAAFVCDVIPVASCDAKTTDAGVALASAGITVVINDRAVLAINERAGRPMKRRVSFADWCAELGVERGS